MGKEWDGWESPASFQRWCTAWAAECLRVLKPGGFMLAFGGTRTWHRLACAVEDAGFEIRDSMHWLYGSGFPKGKACLKPAHEPIVMARKPARRSDPLPGLDACRVTFSDPADLAEAEGKNRHADFGNGARENNVLGDMSQHDRANYDGAAGRWPPNVLLTHSEGCEPTGERRVKGNIRLNPTVQAARANVAKGAEPKRVRGARGYGNADGTETVEAWECTAGCPVAELDRQSAGTRAAKPSKSGNAGGASRFFPVFRYEAKAPASQRPKLPDGTAWPTVKPLDLMRWLVRLVTPPGGVVLDPFAGTGTTGQAALLEGFGAVLIDRDPQALALTRVRLSKPVQPDLFSDLEAS